MNSLLIFDLDDTLYLENEFVLSGFTEVSKYLSSNSEIQFSRIYSSIIKLYIKEGRNQVFDKIIKMYDLNHISVSSLVNIYRYHTPTINLPKESESILKNLKERGYILYLITDGHLYVQRSKIKVLGLKKFFNQTFPSRQFGKDAEKPSLKLFKLIRDKEKISFNQMMYIGDNPLKDFLPLNKLGGLTCQILQGPYKDLKVPKEYEAKFKFSSLKSWFDWLIDQNM